MPNVIPTPSLPTLSEPSFQTRCARWVGRTWAHMTYGRHVEPTWLEINNLEIEIDQLPTGFEGFRIAHLSDLHCGEHLPVDYLSRAINSTIALKPDLIALTGDFVHKGYDHIEIIAKALQGLKAPQGIFAVLGNHDFSVRDATGFRRHRGLHQAIQDALQKNGIRVLRNECEILRRNQCELIFAGVDDLWSRECNPDRALKHLSPDLPRIVMAHNPQTVHRLGTNRCDLMLSGHTHGGQINLPIFGRIFLSKSVRKLAAGLYPVHGCQVYVNKGIGCGFRFRYGVRPELAILTLKAKISSS